MDRFTSVGKKKKQQQESASAVPHDALADLMDGKEPDKAALRFANEDENGNFKPYTAPESGSYYSEPAYFRKPSDQAGVRSGAARSGTYVKEKTSAGATAMKERDWSREKEIAAKAGAVTKTAAVKAGTAAKVGGTWLWGAGKAGVEKLKGSSASGAK